MWTLLLSVQVGSALADEPADPCAPRAELELQGEPLQTGQYVDRVLRAYFDRDAPLVLAAAHDLECVLDQQDYPLGEAEVARIHVALAAATSMRRPVGVESAVVDRYLLAAVRADCEVGTVLSLLSNNGSQADPLFERLNTVAAEHELCAPRAPRTQPEQASSTAREAGDTLPPAWRARLRVDGDRGNTPTVPYYLQVVSLEGDPIVSKYVRPGEDPPKYARLRPTIGKMIAGGATLTAATFTAGTLIAVEMRGSDALPGGSVGGDSVAADLASWNRGRAANHALVAASGGFAALTLGLGAWWVSTF